MPTTFNPVFASSSAVREPVKPTPTVTTSTGLRRCAIVDLPIVWSDPAQERPRASRLHCSTLQLHRSLQMVLDFRQSLLRKCLQIRIAAICNCILIESSVGSLIIDLACYVIGVERLSCFRRCSVPTQVSHRATLLF